MTRTGHPVYDAAMSSLTVCDEGEISLYGVVYDVHNFLHPGGQVWIRACEGKDATALFESVHVNHDIASSFLKTLRVVRRNDEWSAKRRHDTFGQYARMRRRMLAAFPTRASRAMPRHERTVMYAIGVSIVCAHAFLCVTTTWTLSWWLVCGLSSILNTVGGAYGHNAVHRLDPAAVLLDWNGLSCFEWIFEHVISHHPNVNTVRDHDALSMEPFIRWLPHRSAAWFGDASSWTAHLIYLISETAVALQGFVGHRLRWKAGEYEAPTWMCLAPWLFVARLVSLVLCMGLGDGLTTFLVTMTLAGYYFSVLAHLSHVDVDEKNIENFALAQMRNTVDIGGPAKLSLFLDRQRMHHLFPTIDHTRLGRKFPTNS